MLDKILEVIQQVEDSERDYIRDSTREAIAKAIVEWIQESTEPVKPAFEISNDGAETNIPVSGQVSPKGEGNLYVRARIADGSVTAVNVTNDSIPKLK